MVRSQRLTYGFTLIELSIVLIIIGLLAAAVLAGKHLIQSAEIRKTLNQITSYELASNAFYLKYTAIPGDMSNAYTIWGASCGEDAESCNGNGNGIVEYSGDNEPGKLWQHLSLAGLISGAYKGSSATTADEAAPKGPGGRGYFFVTDGALYYLPQSDKLMGISGINNLLIYAGGDEEESSPQTLTAAEAFNLDNKLDDGVANRGKVWTGSKAFKGWYATPGLCGDLTTGAYTPGSKEYVCVSGYSTPSLGGGEGLQRLFEPSQPEGETPEV